MHENLYLNHLVPECQITNKVNKAKMACTNVVKMAQVQMLWAVVWSGVYININLPTFFFLRTKLCAKNDYNFVRKTSTFYERQLCQNFMYDPMKCPERLTPVCMAPWNFLQYVQQLLQLLHVLQVLQTATTHTTATTATTRSTTTTRTTATTDTTLLHVLQLLHLLQP